jgi:nucleoside recognition membrane protein YjiH
MAFFPDQDNRNFDHQAYRQATKNQMAYALATLMEKKGLSIHFNIHQRTYWVERQQIILETGFKTMVDAYQWTIQHVLGYNHD